MSTFAESEKEKTILHVSDEIETVSQGVLTSNEECYLENYQLGQVIGRGGMGIVYKATQKSTGKVLAIKMLHKELAADPVNVKRFEQEVQSARSITHPHIVSIYDSGVTADGAPFLVMDYLDGMGLDTLIKEEGFLDKERFFDLFIQVLEALSEAHKKNIVHRDLKPSNIMVLRSQGGHDFVKLVDFGIARVLQQVAKDGPRVTQTGDIMGSPVYMSPEQCLGLKLDERSDIYSLGVVMYEALSGALPFTGDNAVQITVKHIHDKPPPVGKLRPDFNISSDLESIVMTCLEKDPAERFQNVEELLHQLRSAGQTKKITFVNGARLRTRLRKSLRAIKRIKPKQTMLGALCAGLIVVAPYFAMTHLQMLPMNEALQSSAIGESEETLSDRAQIAMLKGNYQGAIKFWQEAIDKAHQQGKSALAIADIAIQAGDSLACKILMVSDPKFVFTPSTSLTMADFGRAPMLQGATNGTIEPMQSPFSGEWPPPPDLQPSELLRAKAMHNFYTQARILYQQANAGSPEQIKLLDKMATLEWALGNTSAEENLLNQRVKLAESGGKIVLQNILVYRRLAILAKADGRIAQESANLEKIIAADEIDAVGAYTPGAAEELANVYHDTKQYSKEADALRVALNRRGILSPSFDNKETQFLPEDLRDVEDLSLALHKANRLSEAAGVDRQIKILKRLGFNNLGGRFYAPVLRKHY